MSPAGRLISEAELEVLKLLWDHGPATPREVLEQLQARGSTWAYNTVQTLLQRLLQKGYVARDESNRAHVFRPRVSRDSFLQRELNGLAEKVCDGATTPLVLGLVRGKRFSAAEIARFRELLDELEQEPAHQRRKSTGKGESGRKGSRS